MESDPWCKGIFRESQEMKNHVVNQLAFASRCHNSLQKGCFVILEEWQLICIKNSIPAPPSKCQHLFGLYSQTRKLNLPLKFTCILVVFWNYNLNANEIHSIIFPENIALLNSKTSSSRLRTSGYICCGYVYMCTCSV